MPGTPLTWLSMAVVVVCSTVCASAPVKLLVICTVGGVISGYWLIGIFRIASDPTNKITSEITIAVTGLLRKILEDFILIFYLLLSYFQAVLFRDASPCSRPFWRRHLYGGTIS